MASSRKSMSDFLGHSWSSWSEYAGNLVSPDDDLEDSHESSRKSSEVMQLVSSDMGKFGLFPETDCFCTVVCNECGALVKPQGLLTHTRMRHKGLLQNKVSPEKLYKLNETSGASGIGGNDKSSAKYMLNEKLLSKLALSEKLGDKSVSNEKVTSSPTDKHLKSAYERSGSKHVSSDKSLNKATEKLSSKSTGDKPSKSVNDKSKIPLDKSGMLIHCDKSALRADNDKLAKSLNDSYSKQVEPVSSKCEKSSKFNDKILKPISNDKFHQKLGPIDDKTAADKGSSLTDKILPKVGEKISVKSVLSEKLLSKAAASDRSLLENKLKNTDGLKVENIVKTDRPIAKPVMKSLLKEKILKAEGTPSLGPGSSVLKPVMFLEKEAVSHGSCNPGSTTLSPPVLTPQNRTPERYQSATDMPVLSRKRKYREKKVTLAQYDPDRHCGVWCDYFNKFCMRSLTCKVHSIASRRAVVGRSKPFDQLLVEHRRAKEDQRLTKDEQDEVSEASPQLSDRVQSPSEPSSSPFINSPYASPISSPIPSPSMGSVQGTSLSTPSELTTPPIPSLSYQYPPYPPPLPASPSLPDNTVTLSPHLSTPLLNVTLPGLSPCFGVRSLEASKYGSESLGKAKIARAAAREINRLHLNKGRQFNNVKQGAFPPKPLRTCLFQGRKSSGMFVTQRELEAMRSGFRSSIVRAGKSMPLSHLSLASQSPAHLSAETLSSNTPISVHSSCDSSIPSQSISTSQVNTSTGLKSVLGTLCAAKTVINPTDIQQRVSRTQKFTILVLRE